MVSRVSLQGLYGRISLPRFVLGGGGGEPNMRSGQSCRTIASMMYIITIKWATYLHVLVVSRSQTLTPREGEGESLVKCYISGCSSASYEARPIRSHL